MGMFTLAYLSHSTDLAPEIRTGKVRPQSVPVIRGLLPIYKYPSRYEDTVIQLASCSSRFQKSICHPATIWTCCGA